MGSTIVPTITLNNGKKVPVLGLGTWKADPGVVASVITDAIEIGYRHFDCAYVYGNEKEIGDGIRKAIETGKVKREDLFITSKLWNTYHRPDMVEPALKMTLKDFGLDYIDLYLIHWPFGFKEGDELFPTVKGEVQFSDVDYVDTWRAMELVLQAGLTHSIGVSNFSIPQLERILQETTTVPAMNQIECHPYLIQRKLSEFCRSKGISITAYSPLGSKDRPWALPTDPQVLTDPKVLECAKKYGKTPAQLLLRYQIQREHIAIPKSSNKKRLAENFDIWDFELSPKDMDHLDSFHCNERVCPFNDAKKHKYHPFTTPDE